MYVLHYNIMIVSSFAHILDDDDDGVYVGVYVGVGVEIICVKMNEQRSWVTMSCGETHGKFNTKM